MTLQFVGDHVWQSTLFAAVAGLITLALRRNRAHVRHWIWLAASVKFLIPFAALVALGGLFEWRLTVIGQPTMAAVDTISQPFSRFDFASAAPASTPLPPVVSVPMLILMAWLVGCLAILMRWWLRWRKVAAMAREASPIPGGRELEILRALEQRSGISRPTRLVSSSSTLEPGIFGVFKPMLLWPQHMVDRLNDAQVEAIIAHEVCHVRRQDNLFASIHMLIEAVFWFHPLVWWIGGRLVDERERACDEEVIRLGSEPRTYADSILKTCEFCVESPLVNVSGVTGADLKRRIQSILANPVSEKLNLMRKLLLATAFLVAITGPTAFGALRSRAPRVQPVSAQSRPVASVPAIEVASIKANRSGSPGPNFGIQSGGYAVRSITARLMLQMAYGVQQFQIAGAPDWLSSERFDIAVKLQGVDGKPPFNQLSSVFLELLNDRFLLRTHRETREGPVFALLAEKGASKLQVAKGMRPHFLGATGYLSGTMDIRTLSNSLGWQLGRPVLDKTGLADLYDVELIWTQDASQRPSSAPVPPLEPSAGADLQPLPMRMPPPVDPLGPGLFTALPEQLGLRLDSQRGPIEFVVVDHIEQPTPD